jgi:hypothetical protein
MSDHWEQFPCTMGDHAAFISYDHGVREELGSLPFTHYASFKVDLLNPDDRGLPQDNEFAKLNDVEDFLCARFTRATGVQVGRITTNGRRYFHFYTSLSEGDCTAMLEQVQALHGHDIALLYEPDLERSHYWNELFPTEDDWQVIQDLRVEDSLKQKGDSLQIARPIEHWAYFHTEAQRTAFVARVNHAFDKIELNEDPDTRERPFTAKLSHTGLPDYRSMNSKTLLLSRAAKECGGDYDGWETIVCGG